MKGKCEICDKEKEVFKCKYENYSQYPIERRIVSLCKDCIGIQKETLGVFDPF